MRHGDVNQMIVAAAYVNGVKSVDAAVVYQMPTVKTHNMFYIVNSCNRNMSTIIIYSLRTCSAKLRCNILLGKRQRLIIELKHNRVDKVDVFYQFCLQLLICCGVNFVDNYA